MAVNTTEAPLIDVVRTWDRRYRAQQTLRWLPRALMPGLILAILVGLVSRLRPVLENPQVAILAAAGALVGVVAMLASVWLRERTPEDSARRFDVTFGLKERVSTALELAAGRIQADPGLAQLQLADAYDHARTVDAKSGLPLDANRAEWGLVALMALIVAALVLIPNPQADAIEDDSARQQVVNQAIEDIEDAIETVATDPTLDADEREDLLEALEVNLATLQDEDISAEEALATLGDVEELLRDQAGELDQQAQQSEDALEVAAESLQEAADPAGDDSAQEPQGGTPGEQAASAAQDVQDALDSMDAGDMDAAADALEQASDALGQTSPDAAQDLQQAAESLREQDTAGARDALEQAQQSLGQAGQQQQDQQQSADSLQQSADQMDQTQQQQGQQGEQSEDSQQGQGNTGNQEPQGQQDQPADQSGSGAQSGGEQEQPGSGDDQSEQSGDASDQSAGAGDAAGSDNQDTSGFDGETQQGPQADNQTGEEREFDSVFAPRRPDADASDTEIELEPDVGDAPLREGEFSDNPAGESVVPYNEVFGDYADAANEALNQGRIPLGMRDVVRDYFTSLAPGGDADDE